MTGAMPDPSACRPARAARRRGRLLLAALALGALCGCHATFRDPSVPAGRQHAAWAKFYLAGVVGHERIDIRDYCPSGRVHEVETAEDAQTLVLTVVTLGIYAPRRVFITCGPEKPR